MRKILITNDDGIYSDGIIRLAQTAKEFGEVWVVAPDSQRSAMSHSITLRHPIEAWSVDFPVEGVHAYACDGTPADCVRIGVLNIVPGNRIMYFPGLITAIMWLLIFNTQPLRELLLRGLFRGCML